MPNPIERFRDVTKYNINILFMVKGFSKDWININKLVYCGINWLKSKFIFGKKVFVAQVIEQVLKHNSL